MANKDAHHSVSEIDTRSLCCYLGMTSSCFCFPAVVETSPMMPADYREEVDHRLWGRGVGGGIILGMCALDSKA